MNCKQFIITTSTLFYSIAGTRTRGWNILSGQLKTEDKTTKGTVV